MPEIADFEAALAPCAACQQLPSNIATDVKSDLPKPSVAFHTFTDWLPHALRVLFIAEAPIHTPPHYLYNPHDTGYRATLRKGLFNLLQIPQASTLQGLEEFRRRGYFLTDAIKCRYHKRRSNPHRAVIRTCAPRWLQQEIALLQPLKISTLGTTALRGLHTLPEFHEAIRGKTVSLDLGSLIRVGKSHVLIWTYPSRRNLPLHQPHIEAFRSFVADRYLLSSRVRTKCRAVKHPAREALDDL